MLQKLLISFLFAASFSTGNAQDSLSVPRWNIKVNGLGLLNISKVTAMAGVEFRMAPRYSVDLTVGRILDSPAHIYHEGETYQGWRLRAGGKRYIGTLSNYGLYWGLEAKYNHIDNRNWEQVLRQGGQYQETLLINRSIRTWGGAVRFGSLLFTGHKRRFFLEPAVGLGILHHKVQFSLPPGGELQDAVNQIGRAHV